MTNKTSYTPITINGIQIKPNEHGQYCLNEIAKAAGVDKRKYPGQWRTKAAKEAERMQKLHSFNRGTSGSETWADELTALKYAGWVSHEFESMVYEAFTALRNNSTASMLVAPDIENEEARELFKAQATAFLKLHDKETQHDHFRTFKHIGKDSYQTEVDKFNSIAIRKVLLDNGLDHLSIVDAKEIVEQGIEKALARLITL
ncbi:Uncharacterized protein ChrSV_3353 [Chromobacterium vaccinii]|nr:Uncharacterized protein ChrSW_3353 [Chromobacterium vaccinii]QND90810.1 Uncharacterized protein ChrSV_3353 [Chromobacterium vaccinii]